MHSKCHHLCQFGKHEIKRCLLLGRKTVRNLDSVLKSRIIILLTKVNMVEAMVFPVFMYGLESLDLKKGWAPKNWCFWTVVLKKTFESPLDSKEIKPVNPKGNQLWIFVGRADAEAEAPGLWLGCQEPTHLKRPYPGKDWRQKEKRVAEDKMVR